MAILHCRCQESTALLSVLNSCESSKSRALPRSAPPACLAHGSLEASIHTRRRRLHGADKRLSLGAASRRPVDAAPQSAFLPERINRSCCWGWAAQLLHSCCERTERHGPAKSKDEDGTYYLSSRIREMEVLTLLETNFLLSESVELKVAKVKRATRLALASIPRPMGLMRRGRTASAGPIAAQDATTLRRRAPEPVAPARCRS